MKRPKMRIIFLSVLFLIVCTEVVSQEIKNIIFCIGDGMGLAQLTATRIATVGSDGYLNMDRMPFTGLLKTQSADDLITDSAAAATAMATGYKTKNDMVAMLPDSQAVQTILEACMEKGMSSGMVVQSSITHATPACMATHVVDRHDQDRIAEQLLEKRIQVLMGGGLVYFLPRKDSIGKRKDEKNLLEQARSTGYTVVRNREELLAANSEYLLGLFAPNALMTRPQEPSLSEMTKKAVEILKKDKDGFFLMVEGSLIDNASYAQQTDKMFKQVQLFDEAVGTALQFAETDQKTLVVVTADHETGGLIIAKGKPESRKPVCKWAKKGHTGVMVPIFAYGPDGQKFVGVKDNTDIPKLFAEILEIGHFPRILDHLGMSP